jgi:ribonuclease P protein component
MHDSTLPVSELRLPQCARLRRRRDFLRLMTHGRRVVDRRLQLWGIPNGLDYPRFGLIVGRRHGSAVRRNLLRRRLREAFRLTRTELPPGLDLACGPQPGVDIRLKGACESLKRLARRLQNHYEQQSLQQAVRDGAGVSPADARWRMTDRS